MNYKIEEKPEITLTGFRRRFEGTPADTRDQDYDLWITTRVNQYVLSGLAPDRETCWEIISDQTDDGYDFRIAWELTPFDRENWDDVLNDPDFTARYDHYTVPAGLYLVVETEKCMYPSEHYEELRRRAVNEWLPASGYEMDDRPELHKIHWYFRAGDDEYNSTRYTEFWLPVVKK